MVHESQRLALLVKSSKQARRVEARPDQLEGNAPLHGFDLVGNPNLAHAPLAELCPKLVAVVEEPIGREWRPGRSNSHRRGFHAAVENSLAELVGGEQFLDALPQARVAKADLVEIRLPLGRVHFL